MPSEVDICNLALQQIGAKSISSLGDDSPRARACNRVYAHARDSEIRAHPWSFARARVSLAAKSTDPAFGYSKAYQLPADFLRLLPTREQTDFQIEGGDILTDDGAPLKVVYLRQVTDPNTFDQGFIDLLVARVARDVSEKINNSSRKLEAAQAIYLDAKAEARRVNAFERPPQEPPTDTWITARY